MRITIVTLLIITHTFCLRAQVTNSWSSDKTGLFYYSIDTLVKIIKKEKKIDRIIISDNEFKNHQDLPDKLNGIKIVKAAKLRSKYLTNDDIWIDNPDIQISQDTVWIMLLVYHKPKKKLTTYKSGGYSFQFRFLPETKIYRLEEFNAISINAHFYKRL